MKESSCLITKVRLIIVRRYAALDHSCRVRRDFDSTNHSDILDFVARARLCWSDLRLQHHVLFSARACVVRVLERGLSVLHQVFARWQSPNHLKNCFAFCAATCLPLAARDHRASTPDAASAAAELMHSLHRHATIQPSASANRWTAR
jgi:hypothetical protein